MVALIYININTAMHPQTVTRSPEKDDQWEHPVAE